MRSILGMLQEIKCFLNINFGIARKRDEGRVGLDFGVDLKSFKISIGEVKAS